MADVKFSSEITVELIDHMGDDERIAHAAMVSTRGMREVPVYRMAGKIDGLLNTLMEKRHGTPFEHGSLTVRVHAPIKVFREWHRHRTWSYNEESGRYKQLEPLFYIPPRDRPLIEDVGFKNMNPVFRVADTYEYDNIVTDLKAGYENAYRLYENMLYRKCDKGVARDVLGVGIYSSMYATCNPRSILHFLELRTMEAAAKRPSKPLWEIAVAAKQLEAIFAEHWPITHELWNKHGRMAP